MSLTIGDLVGRITADDSGMRVGLANAQLRMRGFRRDVESELRQVRERFAATTRTMGEGLGDSDTAGNRFGATLGRLSGMAGGLGKVALSVGGIAAKLGAAVPLAAGLVGTLANVAPAAALAATGLVAIQLATHALKLGMVGVGEAVSAALDPEKAAEFNEAIKKLSPSARAFALEVKELAPEFKALQQAVQERLFKGLDDVLTGMGKTTLPILRNGLVNAAGALNLMGKGVGNTAIGLSKSGTLGTAISGATAGLMNLSRVPGQIVKGLTQVAAAAAPSFARLTEAAGNALDRVSERFDAAFETGRVEAAIEQAISLIGELAEVGANVFKIVGSIFSAAEASGGGFIAVLQDITGALADAFASPEVQGGLKAIFATVAKIAEVAAPLLISALKVLGPVFEKLGPPIQTVVEALGDGLGKVIDALGPVLESGADAFGKLMVAVAPLLPLAGELIAALLPALIPLFDALGRIFEEATPFIKLFAETLGAILAPLLLALGPIVEALLEPLVQLAEDLFPVLTDLLIELAPSLILLAEAFAELLIELAPIISEVFELSGVLAEQLLPIVAEVAIFVAGVLAMALRGLAMLLKEFVIPTIKILASVLSGDFDKAGKQAVELSLRLRQKLGEVWAGIKVSVGTAALEMRSAVVARATEMRNSVVARIVELRSRAVEKINGLPAAARAALGDLGSYLSSAGRSLVQGFINGITSNIPSVRGVLSNLTSMLPSWKGPESLDAKILTPAGQSVIEGFQRGIQAQIPALRAQLQGLTGEIPGVAVRGMAGGAAPAGGGVQTVRIELAGPEEVKRFIRKIVQVDGRGNVQTAFGQ